MPADPSPPTAPAPRVASIDAFRGLTILAMIFVNDVARVRDIPAWMKHAPEGSDAMTFVDVVFPAFLFAAGLSIPFALGRRIDAGETPVRSFAHVLKRTLGLLVVGVFMVNTYRFDAATPIGKPLWSLLMYVAVLLVWNQYPRSEGARRRLFVGLRAAGFALLAALAVVYRGRDGDATTWMRTSWWGIVGLIGWAYLVSATAYLLLRGQTAALTAMMALMTAVNLGDRAGAFDRLATLKQYVFLGGHIGGHASIMLAGVLAGAWRREAGPTRATPRPMLRLAAGLAAAAFLLRPLHGISKNAATPAWCLYSAAISGVVFAAVHVVADRWNGARWFRFVEPAGANPLLAYILPYLFASLLGVVGIDWLNTHLNAGTTGIIRSIVFSLVMVWFVELLGRARIRLRL